MDNIEKVIARAILENGRGARTIVSLRRKQAERFLSLQAAESSAPVDEQERQAVAELARCLPPQASDEESWSTILAKLRESGLTVRELPLHDYQLQATIDLRRTSVLSVAQAADDATRSSEGDAVARRLHDTIAATFRQQPENIERELASLLDTGDNVGASEYVASERAGIYYFGNRKILELLLRIERASLTRGQRRSVFEAILVVANATSEYSHVAVAAEAMLAEFGPELSDGLKRNLRLCRANAASQAGHRETARVIYNELVDDPGTDAATRAWALRGLSLNVEPLDPAATTAAERAGDAFIEAGNRVEAAKSYLSIAKQLVYIAPERALELAERVLPWFDGQDAGSRNARAGVQHIRVELLSKRGLLDEALDAALDAVALRTGIQGAEADLVSSNLLAAFIAGLKGDEAQRKRLETTAAEIVDGLPVEQALRFRIWRASPQERQKIRETRPPGWDEDLELAFDVLDAARPSGRTYDDRIATLERAQERLKSGHFHLKLDLDEQIAAAFAEVHRQHGSVDQEMAWYRRVLARDPAHRVARQNLAALLQKRGEWRELIDLLRTQIQIFGEYPMILFTLGRALIEVGSPAEAIKPLDRAKQLALQPELVGRIEKELHRAISQAPDAPPSPPLPATQAVYLREVEASLNSFAEHVKRDRRMEFWRRENEEHRWRSDPESLAKSMLWSYLQGHFQGRVEVLEEVRSGAGRIDLYLCFEGGLRIVTELKMCGAPYSAGYAENGIDQLAHYMENKGTSLSYLIVFDARKRDNAKNFQQLPDTGANTIHVVFVDVRPKIME